MKPMSLRLESTDEGAVSRRSEMTRTAGPFYGLAMPAVRRSNEGRRREPSLVDAIVAVRLLGIAQQSSPKQKTNWVVTVIFVVAVLGIAYWLVFTDSGKAAMAASRRRKEAKKPKAISQVGVKSEAAGLACPKCGGTQFKAARRLRRSSPSGPRRCSDKHTSSGVLPAGRVPTRLGPSLGC